MSTCGEGIFAYWKVEYRLPADKFVAARKRVTCNVRISLEKQGSAAVYKGPVPPVSFISK
jgi:hypothetical protein